MPQSHFTPPRGSDISPTSVFVEGRFGRLFRNLPAHDGRSRALRMSGLCVLAELMAQGK
jgi:hypothetical protein